MQKTIVVELEDHQDAPVVRQDHSDHEEVKAHDENGDAGVGDRVSLMETRPLSATSVGAS